MEPWWRTITRAINITRYWIIIDLISVISSSYRSDNSCMQCISISYTIRITIGSCWITRTQRKTYNISTMFYCKFNSRTSYITISISFIVKYFKTHKSNIWSHTSLCTRGTITTYSSSAMRTMSMIIYRVIVIINKIITVIRIFRASIP